MVKRRFAGGVILCLTLCTTVVAGEPPATVVIGTPPQPSWVQLNNQQRSILAPLSRDWDSMENVRKKKWLGIAERYPNLKADEQLRMTERMREWASLTPTQRSQIRGTYKDFIQLPEDQKKTVKQKWEAYSNLPPEEKQRVRESGKSSKLLAPPPAAEPLPPETQSITEQTSAAGDPQSKRP